MVVDNSPNRTDLAFRALSDPTRRDIVRRTADVALSVSTLARAYAMSFAAVQKHVAVLEAAGLVTKTRSGREQLVKAGTTTLELVRAELDTLESTWRGRFDRMGELLAHDDRETPDGRH